MTETHPYQQVFELEFDSYASAIVEYPGEVFPELVFRIVRELEESFVTAIHQGYTFDIISVSRQLAHAAKFIVHDKDIVFCILSIFPPARDMSEETQYTVAKIIEQVEQTYGGALERLEKKWVWESKYQAEERKKVA